MSHDDFAEVATFVALMLIAPYIVGTALMALATPFVPIWFRVRKAFVGGNDDNG